MKKSFLLTALSFSLLLMLSCQDTGKKAKKNAVQNKEAVVATEEAPKQQNVADNQKKTNEFVPKVNKPQRPTNDENYSDFKKNNNGLLYKFHRDVAGATLTTKDVIEIEMNYFLNDSLLFTSSSYPKQFKVPVENSIFKGDFYEGILMMSVGDSASFVVRADSTYRKLWKQSSAGVKPEDVVRFDISILAKEDRDAFSKKLYEKKKSQADQSRADLQVYLHDNDIVERPRPSGLIMVPIIQGYGPKAKGGDKVKIHYTATLINGAPYKSTRTNNVPEIVTLSSLGREHPRGLDEALHQMRVGDVKKFIIPSHLAFGQEERPGLPPFANFVYEVELLEIIE